MTDKEILQCAEAEFEAAAQIRRQLHRCPELGNSEHETTRLISDRLSALGIEVFHPLETGAVGVLRCGSGGKTVALRADIDALPVLEETGLEYASQNRGIMHACGHDIHTAALLCAAKVLSERREELCGTIIFIFQPDEEGYGGAKRLLDKGIFSEKPDYVFGIHIRPELPAGSVAVRYGKSYAASDIFTITVTGKGSHAAEPHKGINALNCAAQIALSLEGLCPRLISPTDSAVVSVCTLESGTACNIIPERAVMTGIIRSLGQSSRALLKQSLTDCCHAAASARGCEADVELYESYPGVVNDDKATSLIERCARQLFPSDCVKVLSEPTMTTEDFGYYLQNVPGCFYHVGAQSEYPLHSGKMAPNEKCLITAAAMHIKSVYSVLRER